MKVLFVLNHFMPQQTAGTEVYTWALSKQLMKMAGIEVSVIIPNYGKKENDEYVYDGITVFKYAEPSVDDRNLIMGFKEPEGLVFFKEYLAKFKPDIIHFHELAPGSGISLPHLRAAKKYGAQVVTTLHLVEYSCMTSKLLYKDNHLCDGKIRIWRCSSCYLHNKGFQKIAPLLLPVSYGLFRMGIDTTKYNTRAGTALGTANVIVRKKKYLEAIAEQSDKIIVLTQWYKKILVANGIAENKLEFIPQGLPLNCSPDLNQVEKERTLPLKVVFLGRIDPLKGLHLLTEAIMMLPEEKFSLDIYGQSIQSSYENELKEKTASYKNICWKGKIAQSAVVETLKEYDLLCLPSTISEMSPLVIQEAYAARVPVLASDVLGNAEQISHNQNGLLFHFNSVVSLKEQLMRCIDEPGLLIEMKSKLPAPVFFDKTANTYFTIYQTLLGSFT